MKSCFCTGVFPHAEMEQAVARLADLGYDGVEFWDQYLKTADIPALTDLCRSRAVEVLQVCPYFDFTGSRGAWEESVRTAERYVGWARTLSCRHIRVFTGSVGSAAATPDQWRAGVEGLRAVCRAGLPDGILFVLETHPGSLMDTGPATLRLLADVGMENLKVNLQVPLFGEPDPLRSAEALGEHVVHLHAHNWAGLRDDFSWADLTYLDAGAYDFAAFVGILRRKSFDGPISIEHGNHMGARDPWEVATHEAAYLKGLIASFGRNG